MGITRRPARPADEAAPERSRPSRPEETDEDTDAMPVPSFRGGWTAGRQQAEATSDYAQAFKPESNSQIVKFLDDSPYVNYRRHWVERTNASGGKSKRPYVCPQTVGKRCALCDIGDKPQAVSSFNVAVIGDDGVPVLRTWDVGVKLFNVLAGYHEDPKVGPLTRGYFAVSMTAAKGKNGSAQTNVNPVKPSALEEDWGTVPPSPAELEAIGRYDADVVTLPKKGELEEIAAELASDD